MPALGAGYRPDIEMGESDIPMTKRRICGYGIQAEPFSPEVLMNTTTIPNTVPTRARNRIAGSVIVCALATSALTACQTSGTTTSSGSELGPTLRQERALPPADIDLAVPADRIAESIERAAAAQRERAERYRGLPADRVEDKIERETAE